MTHQRGLKAAYIDKRVSSEDVQCAGDELKLCPQCPRVTSKAPHNRKMARLHRKAIKCNVYLLAELAYADIATWCLATIPQSAPTWELRD